jgi:hypothetical protein
MKVLVIDDYALIREALPGVLKELQADAIVLEAADWRQAAATVEAHHDSRPRPFDLEISRSEYRS